MATTSEIARAILEICDQVSRWVPDPGRLRAIVHEGSVDVELVWADECIAVSVLALEPAARIDHRIELLLSDAQDLVVEGSRSVWPNGRNPSPFANLKDGQIQFGFIDRESGTKLLQGAVAFGGSPNADQLAE